MTVFGDGSQTRCFCFVDDLIRGLVPLAESDVHEPVNIGNPNEMTLLEMAKPMVELTDSRSEILFEALPVDDPQVRQPDITRARDLLGWEPEVELRDGPAGDDRVLHADARAAKLPYELLEAKNLEAIVKAIEQHDRNCEYPAVAVAMNPFEVERLGWDTIKGLPIRTDPNLGTGRFNVICGGRRRSPSLEESVEAVAEEPEPLMVPAGPAEAGRSALVGRRPSRAAREPRQHPHAAEPLRQPLRLVFQSAPRLGADVLQRLQLDLAVLALPPATDDPPVPPDVGPALPAVSKSCSLYGPRYQSRSFQPIVVGSSGGSSAAHGSTGSVGSRSSGSR